MAGAIPSEPGAADLLGQARQDAVQSLRDASPALADHLGQAAITQGGTSAPSGALFAAGNAELPGPSDASIDEANKQGTPAYDGPPDEKPAPEKVEAPSFWDSALDVAKNYGMRAAKGVNQGLEGTMHLAVPVMAAMQGQFGESGEKFRDEMFNQIDQTFEPAIKAMDTRLARPDQQVVKGSLEDNAGSVIEGLAPLATGPEGFLAGSTMNTANDYLKQNVDIATVYKLTGMGLLMNGIGLGLPLGSPKLLIRMLWGSANVPLTVAQEALAKKILADANYKKLADQIHPLDPASLVSSGLLPMIVAVAGGPHGAKLKADGLDTSGLPPPGPTPASAEAAGAHTATAPSDASVAAATEEPEFIVIDGKKVANPNYGAIKKSPLGQPKPATSTKEFGQPDKPVEGEKEKVADVPSAEPVKDIRAQIKDMLDDTTPRNGVFLSKANQENIALSKGQDVASIQSSRRKAVKEGRIVTFPNGILIVKDKSMVKDARTRLAKGEDPQSIIGDYTGAGKGKTPDQTAVVQGQDKQGAVVTESAVTPAEVPAKTAEVKAAGNEPVVTTPAEATQRRAAEVAKENAPAAPAVPPDHVTVHDQIGNDGKSRDFRILTRPTGEVIAVAKDDGQVIELTKMVQAGKTPREALAHMASESGSPDMVTSMGDTPKRAKPAAPAKATQRRDAQVKDEALTQQARETPPVAERQQAEPPTPAGAQHAFEGADHIRAGDTGTWTNPTSGTRYLYEKQPDGSYHVRTIYADKESSGTLTAQVKSGDIEHFIMQREKDAPAAPVEAPKPAEAVVKETPAPVDPDVAAAKKAGVSVEAFRAKRAADEVKAKAMEEAAKAAPPVVESVPAAGEKATSVIVAEEKTPAAKSESATASVNEAVAAPKAKAPKSALADLPDALSTHEEQEQIPEGSKFAAPLRERQDNASTFAFMLRSAAKEAAGKAPITVIERANKAAARAENLTLKSDNATKKGQGTSHVLINALVAEMHKAARELLDQARPGDEESLKPKDAILREKLAKKKAAAAEPPKPAKKPKAKAEPKVEVAVNEKYRNQIKPKPAGDTVNSAMLRLKSKFVHADEEDFPRVEAEVEQEMHELLSDKFSKEDIDAAMAFMRGERRDALADKGKAKRMSETVEDEEQGFSESEGFDNGMSRTYSPGPSFEVPGKVGYQGKMDSVANQWRKQWDGLSAKVHNNGLFRSLRALKGTGKYISTHKLLDAFIGLADDGSITHQLLSHLRKFAPDLPIYVVDEPRVLSDGRQFGDAGGMYSHDSRTIQLRAENLQHYSGGTAVQLIAHEIKHGATVSGLEHAETPFFKAMTHGRAILIDRLRKKYGKDLIDQSVLYLNGLNTIGPKGENVRPKGFKDHFYGLMNVRELVAELDSHPALIEEIVDSENHKVEGEDLRTDLKEFGMHPAQGTLFKRMYTAIARLFSADTDPKLLHFFAEVNQSGTESAFRNDAGINSDFRAEDYDSILRPTEHLYLRDRGTVDDAEWERIKARYRDETSSTQVPAGSDAARTQWESRRAELKAMRDLGYSDAGPGLRAMADENPGPIRGADEAVREMAEGDPVTVSVMRRTVATIKARSAAALRKLTPGLKTEAQLFRDHMSDFGGQHDPANPARQLQEVDTNKNVIMKRITDLGRDVSKRWTDLSSTEHTAVGALLRDATMNRIDPRTGLSDQSQSAQVKKGFAERHAQLQARLAKLSPEARQVFGDVIDTNRKVLDEQRRTNVDTALHIYGADLSPRDRAMLYNVKSPHEYDAIIGEGMPIDIGEGNDKLRRTLADMTNTSEIDGPYAHLGRQGEHVVSIAPEGTREFANEAAAKKFADSVHDLTPNSKATVVERGGKWTVDYKKAQYTSMHENMEDALADKERLEAAGFEVGNVTQKTLGKETTPLSGGMQELMAEAERKINRDGEDAGTETMVQSIRSAFLQITAQRSAFAGSRLARKNVAGVKATEMARNFAEHITSTAWHTAQMRTVFDRASALAKVRAMARDARGDASQKTITRRGTFVHEMALRAKQDLQDYGKGNVANSVLAKLGFANYLASPSHALVWMTQNFTTGIPLGGARWGYGRTTSAFTGAMKLLASPAFRGMIHAHIESGSTQPITDAIMKAIQSDKRFGKWAKGENSAIQQLIDRGTINHSYSDELRKMAEGGSKTANKVLDYARILPNMADQFNRVSTALAGLELTGGDIRKTADFVDEVHADYGSANKPRYFKTIGRVPGMASITMFKTYIQAMAHLLYGNIGKSFKGNNKAEAAKTVAGLMAGNMMFCGLYGAVALEPLRLLAYGIQKTYDGLTGQEGVVHNMKGDIHRWLVDHLGHTTGNLLANGPLPNLLGFDMSNRMGLSDMFFHNPPDLLTTDATVWKGFLSDQLGPMPQMVGDGIHSFIQHWQRGEGLQALLSIIPVKAFHDVQKAVELFNTGKLSGTGRSTTAPSAYDSLVQGLGLRPSSVALQAERQGEVIDAAQAQSKARKSIVTDMVRAAQTGKGQKAAEIRRDSYNRRFPNRPITDRDTVSGLRFGLKDEQAESEVGY